MDTLVLCSLFAVFAASTSKPHTPPHHNNALFLAKSKKMSVQNIIFKELSIILVNFLPRRCHVETAWQQHVFFLLSRHDASRHASCF
jgi:hypothetical protein